MYVDVTHFGSLGREINDESYINQTIKLQERFINNHDRLVSKKQKMDVYGLLKDIDFLNLLRSFFKSSE